MLLLRRGGLVVVVAAEEWLVVVAAELGLTVLKSVWTLNLMFALHPKLFLPNPLVCYSLYPIFHCLKESFSRAK